MYITNEKKENMKTGQGACIRAKIYIKNAGITNNLFPPLPTTLNDKTVCEESMHIQMNQTL